MEDVMNNTMRLGPGCKMRSLCLCIVLSALTTSSNAITALTATLSWAGCPTTVAKNKTTYSGWIYTDAHGIQHTFPGTDYKEVQIKYYNGHFVTYCGFNTTTSFTTKSTDGIYTMTATGNVGLVSPVLITGFVNPKYIVVGITYAPPGPSSNVSYENSTLVGNTTKITDGYSNGVKFEVSVSGTIAAWSIVGGASAKITGSESTEYTQSSGTSNETTISKQTDVKYTTSGTGDAFNPVNHDYDTIWLWLNPIALFSVDLSDSTVLQWNGYGYDKNDTNGLDVFGVQVGWLNGHFGTNPSIQNVLSRSWVNTTEPGMIWPSGEGPGLTGADITTILQADLFTGGYTLPNPLPSTSADGRFTQIPFPPNPVMYAQAGLGNGGGTTTDYDEINVNSSVVGSTASHEFTQAFGIETEFTGGTWFGKFTVNIKDTHTFAWTHTWENTLTTTKTLTKALAVTGPGCPQTAPPCVPSYTGPGQFIVFQDNLYGTFMFYPKP
jgi:hypothetical protein